jgi:hypothetical protein
MKWSVIGTNNVYKIWKFFIFAGVYILENTPQGGGDISRCHLGGKKRKCEEKKRENVKEKGRKGKEKGKRGKKKEKRGKKKEERGNKMRKGK